MKLETKTPNHRFPTTFAAFFSAVILVLAASPEARAQDAGDDVGLCIEEQKVIAIFEKCAPSVVYVTNKALRRSLFSLNVLEVERGAGSGMIWDRSGHIVTNFHVIEGADAVSVALADGTVWEAEIVGVAPDKDMAVLKIDAPTDRLVSVNPGTSQNLKVGQTVLAIGNPFGLDHSLTKGVISARGREIKSLTGRIIRDVIQTDAAINPGNSGGPLIDSRGRLIGMNTAIFSPTGSNAGIGFAVPVDTIKQIVPQLIEYGKTIVPDPGVVILDDLKARQLGLSGAVIRYVIGDTPAAKRGLEGIYRSRRGYIVGDIIVAVNGQAVQTTNDYYAALERFKPGDTVTFTIKRGRALFKADIPLIEIH
jgi:S1-C subfamily serine protease